jgi:hypothetical protein
VAHHSTSAGVEAEVHLGDPVLLGSPNGRFSYRVVRIVSLPNIDLAGFSFTGYDLALITCELPGEGSELDNRMVLGVLTGFRPAPP